jgi:hypothetical protein
VSLAAITARALVETLLSARCADDAGADPARARDAARFVLAERERMPRFLGPAMTCATLAFAGWALLRSGAHFAAQRVERRRALVESWRAIPFGPCADLVRFYESLAVYAWHSRPASAAATSARRA